MTGRKTRGNVSLVGLEVSPEVLGTYLGMTANSITRLATESGLPRTGRGTYPLTQCIKWYLAKVRQRAIENPGDLVEERRKLIVSQREAQDLENAQRRAEMLDSGLVASAMQKMLGLIESRLDELPKLAPELSRLRDPAAMSRLLSDACREVRRKSSADLVAFAKSLSGPDA